MRKIIKEAMNIACQFACKKPDETTEMIWEIGLGDKTDEDIKAAIVNFCKLADHSFSVITPAEFMGYFDPYGHKAAQKRIDETRRLIDGGFE